MRRLAFFLIIFHGVSVAQAPSWTDINGVPGCTALREGASGKLFAVSVSRIYTSTDDGIVWLKPSPVTGNVDELHTYGAQQIVVRNLAGVQNNQQVFLSGDNGVSLTRIFSEPTDIFNPGLQRYMLSNTGDVYAFRNATTASSILWHIYPTSTQPIGTTVPVVGTGAFGRSAAPELSAIDESNEVYVATAQGGLYVSSDFGSSWSFALPNAIRAITIVPGHLAIVAADSTSARDGGIFVSTDHGATWKNLGLTETQFTAVGGDSAGNVLASTVNGNYYYDRASSSWTFVGPVARAADNVLITRSGVLLSSSASDGIFSSTDRGASWSQNGPRNQAVASGVALPSGTLLAGTFGARLYKSTNSGASWHQAAAGSMPDYIYTLASGPSGIYAGTDQGLYGSTDEGDRWTRLPTVSGAVQAVALNSAGLFIGTNFGVYFSADGGATFLSSGLSSMAVPLLAAGSSNSLYAATDHDGVFVSNDNGTTWRTRGLVRNDMQSIAVSPDGHVFVGVYGGIVRATGDSSAWTQHLFSTTYVYSITFNGPSQVYAGTYDGVYVSHDDGDTWGRAGLQGIAVLFLGLDQSNRIMAGGYNAGMYQTLQPVLDARTVDLSREFRLRQNFPNPFNPATTIPYEISRREKVSLTIYNLLGEIVATLVDGMQEPGSHTAVWNASEKPSGVYFYRIVTGDRSEMRRMILVR